MSDENEYLLALKEWREDQGLEDDEEFQEALAKYFCDAIVPALCIESCMVEADGVCPHGCESVMLAAEAAEAAEMI